MAGQRARWRAALAFSAPEQKTTLSLPAWQQTSRFQVFHAGRAVVIASGNGQSPLALYVYDPDGNRIQLAQDLVL